MTNYEKGRMSFLYRVKKAVHTLWFPKAAGEISWFYKLVLFPISFIYNLVFEGRRKLSKPKKLEKIVICIGNITTGGNGKTPLVAMLAKHLQTFGLNPHILTRGYGGCTKQTTLVTPKHTCAQVGEEAVMLSKCAPTWVGANRYQSGLEAIRAQADLLLMDDGFQNFSLQKDLSIIVVDSLTSLGNEHLFPLGPLREHWKSACARADALFVIDEYLPNSSTRRLVDYMQQHNKPVFLARRFLKIGEEVREKKLIAFSGLGGPSDRFLNSLQKEGLGESILSFHAFLDHHPFTDKEAQKLLATAQAQGGVLVTTEKDHIRLSNAPEGSARHQLYLNAIAVPMGLEMDSWDEFEVFITQPIGAL